MRKITTLLATCTLLSACTTAQVASTVATVSKYQSDVASACSIASNAAADPLVLALQASVPDVAQAVSLIKASCSSEATIAALVLSPTSVAWLGTLTTTIKSGGKTVLPAPVSPS